MEKKTPNIYSALAKAQAEFPKIDLDAKVSFGNTNFKYATIANILDAVVPVLTKHGITHFNVIDDGKIKTTLYHGDSDTQISTESPLESGGKMQDYGARITYLRRYLLVSLLGVSAEEDKDHQGVSNDAKKTAEVAVMERAKAAIRESKPNVLDGMLSKFNLTSDQVRDLVKTEMSVQAEKEDSND